mmetsp:Transcript_4959/g.18008  ORF Transcript_4959/g.18008 Transcript_4959/m.18008 type:complete len:200 (+) Transcript_4959:670-1269(+)
MAEGDGRAAAGAAGHVEPGHEAWRRGGGAVLGLQIQPAVGAAKTQPRQRIDRETQAVGAGQGRAPALRLVAVHRVQEAGQVRAAQHGFDLAGQGQGVLQRPGRHDAGMHHQPAGLIPGQVLLPQPVDQGRAVGRREDVVQRVTGADPAHAVGDGEQVQVMVAEQAGGRAAEGLEPAQRRERPRPAVDQVAEQPEAVARG